MKGRVGISHARHGCHRVWLRRATLWFLGFLLTSIGGGRRPGAIITRKV